MLVILVGRVFLRIRRREGFNNNVIHIDISIHSPTPISKFDYITSLQEKEYNHPDLDYLIPIEKSGKVKERVAY